MVPLIITTIKIHQQKPDAISIKNLKKEWHVVVWRLFTNIISSTIRNGNVARSCPVQDVAKYLKPNVV